MKKVLFFAVIIGLFAACNKTETFNSVDDMIAGAAKDVTAIQVEDVKAKLDSFEMFNLIDVREPDEHNHGYIPGSVNIPRGLLEFNIGKEEFWESTGFYFPEKTELFVLDCKKGSRSILAAGTLKKLGYNNVLIIDGGWKKWELSYPLLQEKNLNAVSHDSGGEVGGC